MDTKATGSSHSHTSQEDTLSTASAAAAAAAARQWEAPDTTPDPLGWATPHSRAKPQALGPWPHGGRCVERGWAGCPLTSNLQLQLGGLWPRKAVTKWSHSYPGSWPLQHHDRSLTLYKPSPARSWPSCKRPLPGPCPEAGPTGQVARRLQRRWSSTEAQEKIDSTRALRKSQGSFPYRERRGAQGKLHRAQGMHWRAEAEL